MKPILEVIGVSKKYRIRHLSPGYLTLGERVVGALRLARTSVEDFWALQDVSFHVHRGESLGIIGRNGAGKSTLLKIFSRITPPTNGKIICRGRIASLLEVGTGFHPELTGRENIYLNGSLLGMKRKEIDSRFDEIVDFSGTEKFLDTALKHFSSGMQLRLAFSVAAFLEPEILVIDEVLAVGDAEFQKKSLGKMEDISKSGRTILFVSHNLTAVENLCQRALLLNEGKVIREGVTNQVIKEYQQLFRNGSTNRYVSDGARSEAAYFQSLEITLSGEQPSYKLRVDCSIQSTEKHKDAFVAFDISNSMGITVMQAIPQQEPFFKYRQGLQPLTVEIDLPPLIPDVYKVSAWIGSHNTETISWEREVTSFEVVDSPSKGRNFPHSHSNGFVVPASRIIYG